MAMLRRDCLTLVRRAEVEMRSQHGIHANELHMNATTHEDLARLYDIWPDYGANKQIRVIDGKDVVIRPDLKYGEIVVSYSVKVDAAEF